MKNTKSLYQLSFVLFFFSFVGTVLTNQDSPIRQEDVTATTSVTVTPSVQLTPQPEQNSLPKLSAAANKSSKIEESKDAILVYHTHNRESWLPELKSVDQPNQAFDSKINVTLLGEQLVQQLQAKGIKAIHSRQDYPSSIPSFNYAKSYAYSKTTLVKELAVHNNIDYIIDIHRDSERRDKTTITFKNVSYSQIYFVVGESNANSSKIKQFASRLQSKLNKKLPGISKGIYVKGKSSGNGHYNQSLANNSALIEIGGVDNTLEENYRTVKLIGDAIQEIWHEDHKESSHTHTT